ncbi:uncharacterized protein LOC107862029 isoform X2 [Capsicum annuum]|nr:uncharacterized protein LOC107862029 isoform X2 [Capsicum annuum]
MNSSKFYVKSQIQHLSSARVSEAVFQDATRCVREFSHQWFHLSVRIEWPERCNFPSCGVLILFIQNQSSLSLNWLSARTFGALSWDSPDTITKPTTCIHDCLDVVQAAFGYPKNQCQGLRKFYVKSQIQQLSTEK